MNVTYKRSRYGNPFRVHRPDDDDPLTPWCKAPGHERRRANAIPTDQPVDCTRCLKTAKLGGANKPQIEPVSLEAVMDAAYRIEMAERDLVDAIWLAEEAGNSRKQIAHATGISWRTIDRIIAGRQRRGSITGAWLDGRRNWNP